MVLRVVKKLYRQNTIQKVNKRLIFIENKKSQKRAVSLCLPIIRDKLVLYKSIDSLLVFYSFQAFRRISKFIQS